MSDDLVQDLLKLDAVRKVHVSTTIHVTHRKTNTGEVDKHFQEIRERVVSEDEFQSLADEHGFRYSGTVDVIGDFNLKDKFTTHWSVEAKDGE